MNSLYDVVVAGAGPAGMAAALTAAEAGARVLIADENSSPGGQIWRGYDSNPSIRQPHAAAFRHLAARLKKTAIEVSSAYHIVACPSARTLRLESESGARDVRYQCLILATGARELFLPFPGWTLPGITGVGALQALVKSGLPIAGKRVVLAGSGPLLLAVAASLAKRGAQVLGVFEQARFASIASFGLQLAGHPRKIAEGIGYRLSTRNACYRTGAWISRADADQSALSVTISVRGSLREIACDYAGCGFHLVPNLELPRMLGCRVDNGFVAVDADQRTSIPDVFAVGELTGIGGLDKALVEGEIAGHAALNRSPRRSLHAARDRYRRFAAAMRRAFALRPELRELADDSTYICRCEDVALGALAGRCSWRDAKLHTRCGMGACQGRICGPAAEFLFGWLNDTVRPPLLPSRIDSLALAPDNGQESSSAQA